MWQLGEDVLYIPVEFFGIVFLIITEPNMLKFPTLIICLPQFPSVFFLMYFKAKM